MSVHTSWYARPETLRHALHIPPQVASWDRAGSTGQLKLEAALTDAQRLLAQDIRQSAGPIALRLDVGLSQTVGLTVDRDLDNYLFPLAVHLGRKFDVAFTSVWATKQPVEESFVRVSTAVPTRPPDHSFRRAILTRGSTAGYDFKQQIADQIADANPIPAGPVFLELTFAVGPSRNWVNMWKPTIDSLGALLGLRRPDRPWDPDDGRIVELGMHNNVEPSLGYETVINVGISPAPA